MYLDILTPVFNMSVNSTELGLAQGEGFHTASSGCCPSRAVLCPAALGQEADVRPSRPLPACRGVCRLELCAAPLDDLPRFQFSKYVKEAKAQCSVGSCVRRKAKD